PRTAQAAMRHSDIKLTMNVYTDPRLLDVLGALDVLPALPLDADRGQAAAAMGTDDRETRTLAPTSDKPGQGLSIAGNPDRGGQASTPAVSDCDFKKKGRLSSPDNRPVCRGDWIRTSDLLNPIQGMRQRKPA